MKFYFKERLVLCWGCLVYLCVRIFHILIGFFGLLRANWNPPVEDTDGWRREVCSHRISWFLRTNGMQSKSIRNGRGITAEVGWALLFELFAFCLLVKHEWRKVAITAQFTQINFPVISVIDSKMLTYWFTARLYEMLNMTAT